MCPIFYAHPVPYNAKSPRLSNSVLDVASLTTQLMAGSQGVPHKLPMVFYSMYEAFKRTKSEKHATSAAYSALQLVLADEKDKMLMLAERMKHLKISPANGSDLMATKKLLMKHKPNADFMYVPINKPSNEYDANCSSISKPDKWQPQCVQMAPGKKCMKQKFALGGLVNAPLISFQGGRNVSVYLKNIPLAPKYEGSFSELNEDEEDSFYEQYDRVLETSRNLNDQKKFLAEFFQPNGAWLFANVAINELIVRNTSAYESAFALFTVTAAIRDAAVSSATMKNSQSSARPLSVIQCALSDDDVEAWRGPYMGVGDLEEKWRPYLQTPAHPGYVSGHATVTSAGATALALVLGDDMVHSANCAVQKEGMSKYEPRILKGSFGYIAGITDVPNRGPKTVGYSPSSDVGICWSSFQQYTSMLAYSRELGGIHIPRDNWIGVELGKKVGKSVFKFASELRSS